MAGMKLFSFAVLMSVTIIIGVTECARVLVPATKNLSGGSIAGIVVTIIAACIIVTCLVRCCKREDGRNDKTNMINARCPQVVSAIHATHTPNVVFAQTTGQLFSNLYSKS